MKHSDASTIKKYLSTLAHADIKPRVHRSFDYDGGYSIRLYDLRTDVVVEVGKITRDSFRALVVFAKYGDM